MIPMRLLLTACGLVLLATPAAAAPTFKRIWPGPRTAASFSRIAEFFRPGEQTGRETVLRTQPRERGGYYFLARIDNPGPAVVGAQFELSVIPPGATEPRVHRFAADLPPGEHTFNLGLTGTDWVAGTEAPLAWQLMILSPGGQVLTRAQSFLWAGPAGIRISGPLESQEVGAWTKTALRFCLSPHT